ALRLAEEGARVIVNDVTPEKAQETVDAIQARSEAARGRALAADVADSGQVKRMFAEVDREFGALDILVNNAGIAEGTPGDREKLRVRSEARVGELMSGGPVTTHWDLTQDMSDEAWHRMIGVHLDGTFFCTREALRLMARRNRGAIINLSSVAALMGLEASPHYSAAKGGILAFTRAVSREVASRGIRVNAICPGYIDTPMTRPMSPLMQRVVISRTPLGRWGEAEEVAATALFLASDDASYFTGQWLSPNGGLFIG
ncbi:MAG: SDR family NAD(P)-dependent oxidoreductase, partial [Candidatus Rokuibacteriota bacterium]